MQGKEKKGSRRGQNSRKKVRVGEKDPEKKLPRVSFLTERKEE